MLYHVSIGDRTYRVEIDGDGVRLDGQSVDAALTGAGEPGVRVLRLGNGHHRLVAQRGEGDAWQLRLRGRGVTAEVVDERTRVVREMTGAAASASKAATVRAPMPGLVIKVEVEEGQEVKRGQGVVIVEAMKMENELSAESDGRIARVLISDGDTVEKGQVLVELDLSGSA